MDIKSAEERSRNMSAIKNKDTVPEIFFESYYLPGDFDTEKISVIYLVIQIYTWHDTILLYLFMDVSGTDTKVVNMHICLKQDRISGRINFKRI